ncbi:MAG TPA: Crp/Fnr family transcriptional regulator [Xenococcaceae cyanobacterium]
MQFFDRSSEASRPFITWQRIVDWAQTHYRDRIFRKDERIPTRPGLLYLVNKGVIRLAGTTIQASLVNESRDDSKEALESNEEFPKETFLGFVSAGQPFEIVAQSSCDLQAYSHLDGTHIIWLYWDDLDNWPHFRKEVYEALRYQHQRKLLWLSALGQRKTIDRLISLITLLIEEYGEPCEAGYCLPYFLTHAQLGSSIGSTRVTVTRLMGKLRRQGLITIRDDNSICIPEIRH